MSTHHGPVGDDSLNAFVLSGGAGGGGVYTTGGGYYVGGGTSGGYAISGPATTWTTGTFTTVNPFTHVSTPGRLSPLQVEVLLGSHSFIAMENSGYCLFCYALDLYRTQTDHLFVIREE